MPPTNQVVYLGDSLMLGNHVSAGQDIPSKISAAYAPVAANASNQAIGSTYANEDGSHTDGGQGVTADGLFNSGVSVPICVVWFGANDLVTFSAATFVAAYKSYCQARTAAGYRVIACTVLPNSAITSAGHGASVATANASIISDNSFYHALANFASDPIMGDAANNTNFTYYSDGVHPTNTGNDLLYPYLLLAIQQVLGVAIAPDATAGDATNGTTSQTVPITVGAGATALFAAVTGTSQSPDGEIAGCTYNGTPMTLIAQQGVNGVSRYLSLFYIASPTSGTHNIVASSTGGSIFISVAAASYTGSSVTSQPEAFGQADSNVGTVTVVTNNAWAIMGNKDQAAQIASGAAGTTLRVTDGIAPSGVTGLLDSNGVVSPGSNTLTCNVGVGNEAVIVSLAPTGGSTAYTLTADAGSYAITGSDVTLTKTSASMNYTLTADPGSYVITGSRVRLVWSGAPVGGNFPQALNVAIMGLS